MLDGGQRVGRFAGLRDRHHQLIRHSAPRRDNGIRWRPRRYRAVPANLLDPVARHQARVVTGAAGNDQHRLHAGKHFRRSQRRTGWARTSARHRSSPAWRRAPAAARRFPSACNGGTRRVRQHRPRACFRASARVNRRPVSADYSIAVATQVRRHRLLRDRSCGASPAAAPRHRRPRNCHPHRCRAATAHPDGRR